MARGDSPNAGEYELLPRDPDEELSDTPRRHSPGHAFSRQLWLWLVLGLVVALLGASALLWRFGGDVQDHLKPVNATLRARQRSQFELLKNNTGLLGHLGRAHNDEAMVKLAGCMNGTVRCPDRPVILSSYIYIGFLFADFSPPGGEMVWFKSVTEMVEAEGYVILHTHDFPDFVSVSWLIPDLVHMYWAGEKRVPSCIFDPRCIAEYTPNIDGPDLSVDVPEEERGTIPISRLFVTTFWGCYPPSWGHGLAFTGDFKGDDWWSWNPLGPAWALTPYDYPNNTFLPWSIEEVCMKNPYTPHNDRNDTVLLYAKHSLIFKNARIKPDFWNSDVVKALPFKFITTAKIVDDTPLPDGLETLGTMTRENYNTLLGSVKAVVGLGVPTISPTVYSALCQGTPLVLPLFKEEETNELAKLYGTRYSQHPMAVALGAPYVHTYMADNQTQLIQAVEETMKIGLDRFIPPKMREPFVRSAIRKVLNTDFDAKARETIVANGGQMPRHLDHTRLFMIGRDDLLVVRNGTRPRWTEDMLGEVRQ
ncbi:hypothetical protein C8F01DRAFT_260438 [Mycena amicta]|nr:hypothetical protein C8F01DRAFT_260438 [Mycena amicta]